jgi:formylglycine-generating enzyme required for sulfatase activity
VYLTAFRIQRWPTTVAEYRRFMDSAGGYETDEFWSADGLKWRVAHRKTTPEGWSDLRFGNLPVTGLSWWEIEAYCVWYTRICLDLPRGWIIRLPTEAQWEKAARGGSKPGAPALTMRAKRFPWGDDWQDAAAAEPANCDSLLSGPAPVGLFPASHSQPHQLWDMAGNVWERCLDGFREYPAEERPFDGGPAARRRNPFCDDYRHGQVVRGGAFDSSRLNLRVSCRFGVPLDARDRRTGFRCAAMPAADV